MTSPGSAAKPSAAPMLSPVPGPRTIPDAVVPTASAGPATRGSAGTWPSASSQEVGPVGAGDRRPVARARGLASIGDRLVRPAGERPGQVVVGQHQPGRALRVGGLVARHPAHLRHREGGDRHAADGFGPGGRSAELGDEVGGIAADRVSFQSRAGRTTAPSSSSATMPCCWPATASASTPSSTPDVTCVQGVEPGPRGDLGAVRDGPRAPPGRVRRCRRRARRS